MNKYHKHQSKGLSRHSGKVIAQVRCPQTGFLLTPGNSKVVVKDTETGKVVTDKSNHAKSQIVFNREPISW